MKKIIQELSIDSHATIRDVLKQMDAVNRKLLIVVEKDKFRSLISIGDIQRAIIQDKKMNTSISNILREKVTVAHEKDDLDQIKEKMKIRRNEFMPVISENGDLVRVIFWEDLFHTDGIEIISKINLPVVIMAGGVGTRLRPLTNVLPKALIPFGDKTIIEEIMEKFIKIGCNRFYLSVNYKMEMIEFYLGSLKKTNYIINYFKEKQPLGTGGSLNLLNGKINETFFVSNCDILIDQDYSEVLKYHYDNKNEITIIAALKHFPIPYGILNTKGNGILKSIDEKPELTFKINTGFYIMEPHLLKEIPENRFCHITEFIGKLIKDMRKVGIFPVSEGSWKDIGNWQDYLNYLKQ